MQCEFSKKTTTTDVVNSVYVIKKKGNIQLFDVSKISQRVTNLQKDLSVQHELISKRVEKGIFNNITTNDIDILISQVSASLSVIHPDYGLLAGRIMVTNLHKQTPPTFSESIKILYASGKINQRLFDIVLKNPEVNSWIINDRDFDLDYFGFKTLEKSYLLRDSDLLIERPQYMFLRVALAINDNLDMAKKTYDLMSLKFFIHATPTLFNAGTIKEQMSSCFLLCMNDDSVEGIYKTLTDCAHISKHSGGIGLSVHNVRARGTDINSSSGKSNGLASLMRVFNASSRYIDQGGGKRKGSMAIYLEPWHPDVFEFLDLKKNTGVEESRARDLFYALWIPDLFMERVKEDGLWTLFCPHKCPGLENVYGQKFNELYQRYETEKKGTTIQACFLWQKIINSQIETGTPYILYKDHINHKSNQKNLGTIKSSNLCTEIVQFTSKEETAVCNLASVCLPAMVNNDVFNFEKLHDVVEHITVNLNIIIDKNYYPTPEAEKSNLRHRPVGIGVQGLADVFAKLNIPYTSIEAIKLNKNIFETIYHAALTMSCKLAEKFGAYSSFENSPTSNGLFQFDLWKDWSVYTDDFTHEFMYDWKQLKENVAMHGLRNSLLVTAMPTATTAQIMGNHDSFEPFTSNLYVRRVASGEFIVNNKHLVRCLEKLNLWNHDTRKKIMLDNGSIQNIACIPENIKQVFKTVWEISPKDLIDMSADRGHFIDQSQSFNVFMSLPTKNKISSCLMYSWQKGCKTGMYYLRTRNATNPIQFTIDSNDPECKACQ